MSERDESEMMRGNGAAAPDLRRRVCESAVAGLAYHSGTHNWSPEQIAERAWAIADAVVETENVDFRAPKKKSPAMPQVGRQYSR